jgi:hypothetical protein
MASKDKKCEVYRSSSSVDDPSSYMFDTDSMFHVIENFQFSPFRLFTLATSHHSRPMQPSEATIPSIFYPSFVAQQKCSKCTRKSHRDLMAQWQSACLRNRRLQVRVLLRSFRGCTTAFPFLLSVSMLSVWNMFH